MKSHTNTFVLICIINRNRRMNLKIHENVNYIPFQLNSKKWCFKNLNHSQLEKIYMFVFKSVNKFLRHFHGNKNFLINKQS